MDLVTESGILQPILGCRFRKRYFRHNGQVSIKDAYGASIRSYMKALEDMILQL
jgi:hypothetical protein